MLNEILFLRLFYCSVDTLFFPRHLILVFQVWGTDMICEYLNVVVIAIKCARQNTRTREGEDRNPLNPRRNLVSFTCTTGDSIYLFSTELRSGGLDLLDPCNSYTYTCTTLREMTFGRAAKE